MRAGLVAILVGLAGCSGDDGTMQVSWVYGPDTVALELPATAISCPTLGWIEVVGARGDTGVGVVIFPADGQVAGRYVVESPQWREDSATAVASLAVRWFSAEGVLAFMASDGVVLVEDADQAVTGRFLGRFQDIAGTDSLELQGDISNVPVVVGGIECQLRPDTTAVSTPDSSID
jgi:hypothetical protein